MRRGGGREDEGNCAFYFCVWPLKSNQILKDDTVGTVPDKS